MEFLVGRLGIGMDRVRQLDDLGARGVHRGGETGLCFGVGTCRSDGAQGRHTALLGGRERDEVPA